MATTRESPRLISEQFDIDFQREVDEMARAMERTSLFSTPQPSTPNPACERCHKIKYPSSGTSAKHTSKVSFTSPSNVCTECGQALLIIYPKHPNLHSHCYGKRLWSSQAPEGTSTLLAAPPPPPFSAFSFSSPRAAAPAETQAASGTLKVPPPLSATRPKIETNLFDDPAPPLSSSSSTLPPPRKNAADPPRIATLLTGAERSTTLPAASTLPPFDDLMALVPDELARAILSTSSLYDVFRLPRDCSMEEIKSRYRKISLRIHPDKCHAVDAARAFQLVSNAYSILSDANSRDKYDRDYANERLDLRGAWGGATTHLRTPHGLSPDDVNSLFEGLNFIFRMKEAVFRAGV